MCIVSDIASFYLFIILEASILYFNLIYFICLNANARYLVKKASESKCLCTTIECKLLFKSLNSSYMTVVSSVVATARLKTLVEVKVC